MGKQSDSTIRWLAGHVFPFEAELRVRLQRLGSLDHEIDDIVQDAYVQLAELPSFDHIRDGRAYLFATARAILLNRVRHERVVRIDQLADHEAFLLEDDSPGPERRVQARQELLRVGQLIEQLPSRCRLIFEMRRVDGLSRQEIAQQLGTSEAMVAYETARGLRYIVEALAKSEKRHGEGRLENLVLALRKRGRPRK